MDTWKRLRSNLIVLVCLDNFGFSIMMLIVMRCIKQRRIERRTSIS
jgi:hypothetical protein